MSFASSHILALRSRLAGMPFAGLASATLLIRGVRAAGRFFPPHRHASEIFSTNSFSFQEILGVPYPHSEAANTQYERRRDGTRTAR